MRELVREIPALRELDAHNLLGTLACKLGKSKILLLFAVLVPNRPTQEDVKLPIF